MPTTQQEGAGAVGHSGREKVLRKCESVGVGPVGGIEQRHSQIQGAATPNPISQFQNPERDRKVQERVGTAVEKHLPVIRLTSLTRWLSPIRIWLASVVKAELVAGLSLKARTQQEGAGTGWHSGGEEAFRKYQTRPPGAD